MVEPFKGFEPQVGEIRALRTFRIGPGGVLYPLFGNTPWGPGVNTATCRRHPVAASPWADALRLGPAEPVVAEPHRPAEAECTCGFYAYAPGAESDYPHARHVLAVVACWGRVIAGTRGLRCEHARVEALWMSDVVPAPLAAEVADVDPGIRVFADRAEMIAAYPPTVLDCYEEEPPVPARRRAWLWRALVTVGILAGILPTGWLTGGQSWDTWLLAGVVGGTGMVLARSGTSALARRRHVLVSIALMLWLLAPLGGAAGFLLLRLPLLEIALVGGLARHRMRRVAATFPARIG